MAAVAATFANANIDLVTSSMPSQRVESLKEEGGNANTLCAMAHCVQKEIALILENVAAATTFANGPNRISGQSLRSQSLLQSQQSLHERRRELQILIPAC